MLTSECGWHPSAKGRTPNELDNTRTLIDMAYTLNEEKSVHHRINTSA